MRFVRLSGLVFPCFQSIHYISEGQIYSIDLHPSGKFLATCGCDGKGKGLVTIWSTASFNHDYNGSEAEDLPPEDSLVSTVSAQSASIVPSITEVSKSDVAKYKVGEKTLLSRKLFFFLLLFLSS